MTYREKFFALAQSISLSGHSRSNGADWYQCPCCYATQDIKGHAFGPEPNLGAINHEPDCQLFNAYMEALRNDNPE